MCASVPVPKRDAFAATALWSVCSRPSRPRGSPDDHRRRRMPRVSVVITEPRVGLTDPGPLVRRDEPRDAHSVRAEHRADRSPFPQSGVIPIRIGIAASLLPKRQAGFLPRTHSVMPPNRPDRNLYTIQQEYLRQRMSRQREITNNRGPLCYSESYSTNDSDMEVLAHKISVPHKST